MLHDASVTIERQHGWCVIGDGRHVSTRGEASRAEAGPKVRTQTAEQGHLVLAEVCPATFPPQRQPCPMLSASAVHSAQVEREPTWCDRLTVAQRPVELPVGGLRQQRDTSPRAGHPCEVIDLILEVDVLEEVAAARVVRRIHLNAHQQAADRVSLVRAIALEPDHSAQSVQAAMVKAVGVEAGVAQALHLAKDAFFERGTSGHATNPRNLG